MLVRINYVGKLKTWDRHLEKFEYALRTAARDSTEKSPEVLFWGMKLQALLQGWLLWSTS